MSAWLAAILDRPGSLDPAVRRAAAEGAAVPAEVAPLVEKIRHHAHRVTDEDVARLRAAGWSEDQIFELTVATAVGQGMRRWRAGIAALAAAKGGK
jgi:alkylhydroperoxidase family enzyme